MKILYLTPLYKPTNSNLKKGGGDISNKILLDGLIGLGHEVEVITLRSLSNYALYYDGFKIIQPFYWIKAINIQLLLSMIFYKKNVVKHIVNNRPNIILASTEIVPIAAEIGFITHIPVGAIVRAVENFPGGNPIINPCRGFVGRLIRRLTIGVHGNNELGKVTFIVTVGSYMKSKYQSKFPEIPIYIVHPPVNNDIYLIKTQIRKINNVLMIGTSLEKGYDIFYQLSLFFLSLNFICIGAQEIAPGICMSIGNLTRYGWVKIDRAFMEKIDVVLVPSRCEEAFARTSIESIIMGKVVLVSDQGGLPETVAYQDDLIVPVDNMELWRDRLQRLISDPACFDSSLNIACDNAKIFYAANQIKEFEKVLIDNVI